MSNQMFALANNWNVMADPFYAMKSRNGFKLDSVVGISPLNAVRAAMGDEVANQIISKGQINGVSPTQSVLFAAWCYLNLRQGARLQFPVQLGERFMFPQAGKVQYRIAGLELLTQIGSQVTNPKCQSKAVAAYRALTEKKEMIQGLANSYGLEQFAVRQALLAGCYANEGVDFKVLTYALARPVIEEVFGNSFDNTIVYVDHNWTRVFDFVATAKDVAVVFDWLSAAFKKGTESPIKLVPGADGNFSVWMDNTHEFIVTPKDGVFEPLRNRRFNNMLMVSALTGRSSATHVPESDLSLVNSYGSFLYGVLMLGAKWLSAPVPELSQFVTKCLATGAQVPMSSDDEVGAADGDRNYYNRYVTVTRMSAIDFPFGFHRLSNGLKVSFNHEVSISGLGDVSNEFEGNIKGVKLPAKSAVDRAALLGFNLVRMPRGQFIDGRRSCIQAKHLPEQVRGQFIKQVLSVHAGGSDDKSLAAYGRNEFGVTGTDSYVLNQLSNQLIIGLSSKLAKLIKRTAMDAAMVGEFSNGEVRGMKRFGQPDVSAHNWTVEAVVSPHAIYPAGMAIYWGQEPELVVKHTQVSQPNVVQTVSIEEAVVSLYPATYVQENGWHVLKQNELVSSPAGAAIAEVPYVTQEGNFTHVITNSTPDAEVLEIKWREAKVNGNSRSLQIMVVSQTRESQIKGRNNVKCMLARHTGECVVNELNPDLNARSVFFTDTNKWLDLVMSVTDVAACTIIKNADVEGLQLLAAANKLSGYEGVDCLQWSPVLAVLGVYQPLVDWFEVKFGRSVWFRHEDASGEWVQILRQMYTTAKGWEVINASDLVELNLVGAENVTALVDGDLYDAHTNVIVFYEMNGVSYFVQRAYSYAGNSETGAVWQPVKGELSSVRSSVGKTPLMAGVARALEQQDPKFAKTLASDGFKNVHKAAVLYAMANNSTIKAKGGVELLMVMIGDEASKALLQTEELVKLVTNPANAGKLLKVLAPLFKNSMFSICAGKRGHFSVYLPAVFMQDSNMDFSGCEGFSDLVTSLVVQFILGADVTKEEYQQLAGRAKGALSKLTDSSGLTKAPALCRMSMQAKTMSLPGIPLGEVWVRESARANSSFQLLSKV